MCTNELVAQIMIMGLVAGISALLLAGSILGFQKAKRLKKQVAEAKEDPKA